MTAPQSAPKKRGCLFYGCLTVAILTLLIALGGFLAVRYTLGKVNALIEQCTDTAPVALPKADMEAGEYLQLDERVTAFVSAVEGRGGDNSLVLTARDINGMIANNPQMHQWKDRLFITIEGSELKGQISMPTDGFAGIPGLSRLQGRFLNGAATLKASLVNGQLDVRVVSLEVKGSPLPEQFMASLRNENLAKDASQDPKNAAAIQKLESIDISDGKITLKAAGAK